MRFRRSLLALTLVWSALAVVGFSQTKVLTPEDLDKTMKKVGPASRAVPKAIASNNFAEAKTQLGIMRQGLIDAESFWVEHKKQDAIDFNKASIAKLDAYIKVVSAEPVDAAAVTAAGRELQPTCGACHKVYRAQDAENNYILKPGSIGGH
jgi:hypothetical protein